MKGLSSLCPLISVQVPSATSFRSKYWELERDNFLVYSSVYVCCIPDTRIVNGVIGLYRTAAGSSRLRKRGFFDRDYSDSTEASDEQEKAAFTAAGESSRPYAQFRNVYVYYGDNDDQTPFRRYNMALHDTANIRARWQEN